MWLICPMVEAEYFWHAIWTPQITLKWLVKFVFARSVFSSHWTRSGAVDAC
jgi:hypothetical protein